MTKKGTLGSHRSVLTPVPFSLALKIDKRTDLKQLEVRNSNSVQTCIMNQKTHRSVIGRGTQSNPASRFDAYSLEEDFADLQPEDVSLQRRVATQFIPDASNSIVSENNSPDLNFRFSINPYRGCEHGCSYCYARTYHELAGMSAGLDFETKIVYKPNAAKLFRDWLNKQSEVFPINFSGATDCYQPVERKLEITRQCLEVAVASKYPITIVTKNALVLRDLDLLAKLNELKLVHVNISVTSLDQSLTKIMEPRTSSPQSRLRTIEQLVSRGIPTRALLSPIVPGLNDFELPKLVEAVSQAGAHAASSTVVRLPGTVEQIFLDWLTREVPEKARVVESRIRQIRGGELHDIRFGHRMKGNGPIAEQIRQSFDVFAKKFGLGRELPALSTKHFVRPRDLSQRMLF